MESRVQKIEEDMGGDAPEAVLLVQPFKELNRERCALDNVGLMLVQAERVI